MAFYVFFVEEREQVIAVNHSFQYI